MSTYPPWREHYIDYAKLKQLLRETDSGSATQEPWTDADESRFVDELINVQLEKVHRFQLAENAALNERAVRCEQRLEKFVETGGDKEVLEQSLQELDAITKDINGLERFSRINFTGFLKAAKKHDRKSRTGGLKGKGKAVADPKVRPLLQVRLSHLEFNKEDYSPLLYRYVH